MALTLLQAKKEVMELLNVSQTTYGTFDNDSKYKDNLITDAIHDADHLVSLAICETPGHPKRVPFMLSTDIVNPLVFTADISVAVPQHFGPLGPFFIQKLDGNWYTAIPAPAEKITRWRINENGIYGSGDDVNGYYDIVENRIVFSGSTIRVWYSSFTPGFATLDATALISPDEYLSSVVKLALGMLYMKQEDFAQAAAWYYSQGQADLQSIRGMQLIVPPIEQYQQKR